MAVSRSTRDEARRQELLSETNRTPDENSELAALEQRSRSSRPLGDVPALDRNEEGVRGPIADAGLGTVARRGPETDADRVARDGHTADAARHGNETMARGADGHDGREHNLIPAEMARRQALMVQATRTPAEDAELARLTDHRVADAAGRSYDGEVHDGRPLTATDRPERVRDDPLRESDPLRAGEQGRHDNERGHASGDQPHDPNRPHDPMHVGEQDLRRDAAGNLVGEQQRGHAGRPLTAAEMAERGRDTVGRSDEQMRRDDGMDTPEHYPARSGIPERPVQDDRHRALLAKSDRTPEEVAELAALERGRAVDPRRGPHYPDEAHGTAGTAADAARHGIETRGSMGGVDSRTVPGGDYPGGTAGRPMTIAEAEAERARPAVPGEDFRRGVAGRSTVTAAAPLNPDEEARRITLTARGVERTPAEHADLSVLNERSNHPRHEAGAAMGATPLVPRYAMSPDMPAARLRAIDVEVRAAADAGTAAADAATAVAMADAAKHAGTKDSDAKGTAAEAAMKRSAAMHDAAAKASASVTAAREYDRASTVAVQDSVNAQAARALATNAMAAGSADAATLSIAADAADARAVVSAGVADKAANDAEAAAAAADEALMTARAPMMAAMSEEQRAGLLEMKEWVRRELALAYQGASVETRRLQNP